MIHKLVLILSALCINVYCQAQLAKRKLKMKKIQFGILLLALILIFSSCSNQKEKISTENTGRFKYILDMVHHNPGEALIESAFTNPAKLKEYGYNGMVVNDFVFPHAAITFESFDKNIFPSGSEGANWVEGAAKRIKSNIQSCHENGIQCLYFCDIIVLPKKLVELYKDEICNEVGKIDITKPKTQEIHRLMIREMFEAFPALDGLVIRTGENYVDNVPFHMGNNPVLKGNEIECHQILLQLLKEEVCEKLNKTLVYRTWSFDGFHSATEYYLKVTNAITPHDKLIMSIKHTKLDYWRTVPFNPTIGIGKHQQIIEVQCQREYEGKGAYPNYVMNGVINGFEEYEKLEGNKCLNDIVDNPLVVGIWSWSRGGGWKGPYIKNELWIDLNTYVISHWAANPQISEATIFDEYATKLGIDVNSKTAFRELCMLSPKAELRGHYFYEHTFPDTIPYQFYITWTRDQFFAGYDKLEDVFTSGVKNNSLALFLNEKAEALAIWRKMDELSKTIQCKEPETEDFIKGSSSYGRIKQEIICHGWNILAYGIAKKYDYPLYMDLNAEYESYRQLWNDIEQLNQNHKQCASLYQGNSWIYNPPTFYYPETGMNTDIEKVVELYGNTKN
jgi:hypothetical protein